MAHRRGCTLFSLLLFQCCTSSFLYRQAPHARRLTSARGRAATVLAYDDFAPDDASAESLNWLHTQLHMAIDSQDYETAAQLRDRIRRCAGISADEASWSTLGVPDWLADRLERLNLPLPTRVQLHALRATEAGDDAAVCAPTGSGKTLAYLLPLLTQLSDDLLSEDLAAYLASALDGGRPARARAKGMARRRAARDSAAAQPGADGEQSDYSVPTPALLIVVPTRELGVQVARKTLGQPPTSQMPLARCH